MTQIRTGGCQCGALRYEIRGEPLDFYACHCTECRKQSASAFGLSLIVRRDEFAVIEGAPKLWSRPTASGGALECRFCPECGSRLWHVSRAEPELLSVKGGSLDEPPDLGRARHIWVSSKLPGVAIPPDAVCWPEEPPL